MISKVLTRTAPLVSRAALGWTIWLGGAAAALAQVLAQLQDFSPWGFLVCLSLLAALGGLLLARTLSSWMAVSPATAELFAAGVMGTSVIVGLIVPALQEIAAHEAWASAAAMMSANRH